MSKRLGPLEKGIVFPPKNVPGILARPLAEYKRSREFDEKVSLLFKKYNVQPDNWRHLAIALAMEYEVGFKPIRAPGRPHGSPRVWTEEVVAKFIAEVAKLETEYPGITDLQICKMLFHEGPFKGKSPESLRSQLRDLRRQGRLI